MKNSTVRSILCFLIFLNALFTEGSSFAQIRIETPFVVGDALPDAPELAARGTFKVGVQTLDFVHKGQVDILKIKDGIAPFYDRPIKVEVWYPALIPDGAKEWVMYDEVLGKSDDKKRPLMPFTYAGRALRDAVPQKNDTPYPLVIVSHGYVGSRYLLSYLTENLASKGPQYFATLRQQCSCRWVF